MRLMMACAMIFASCIAHGMNVLMEEPPFELDALVLYNNAGTPIVGNVIDRGLVPGKNDKKESIALWMITVQFPDKKTICVPSQTLSLLGSSPSQQNRQMHQ